jgi:hypothetical protein
MAIFAGLVLIAVAGLSQAADSDWYHREGELSGSLKSAEPLPIYDADPQHLWNRLFAVFYIRESNLPEVPGGQPVKRIEGGDYIDFLAWDRTDHWSTPEVADRVNSLLDEFLDKGGAKLVDDPLKRVVMLRDLWATYDFLVEQNIRRYGPKDVRDRRDEICRKLSRVLASLALSPAEIDALPDNYEAAIRSGKFAATQDCDANNDYLPPRLFTDSNEWVEIDFHQPQVHEDISNRFITLHARSYRGRSYFRVFYRYPGGRAALDEYLKRLDETGVDWKQASHDGFILLKIDAPQIPAGTEVALVQFLVTLDSELRPTPTKIVESVRHRAFRNLDCSSEPATNTGFGVHVMEYTLKRHLLFNNLKQGGLAREPDNEPLYRVLFQPDNAADWGPQRRKILFEQCVECHMTSQGTRTGVQSMPSIVHMGGVDAGAQPGIVHALEPSAGDTHGKRVVHWKSTHETYRRLLDYLGR